MGISKLTVIKQLGLDDGSIDPFEKVTKQTQAEYNLSWSHQKPRKDDIEVRLKLYNNQKREKKFVGDTTLFTIFQTVLASLYVDRLDVEFSGKESGDDDVAQNLNAVARSDYDDMEKDIIDFNWDWDTLFSGRGLISFEEYDRDPDNGIFLPIPHNLDFITFLRDPFAFSINGDRKGRGATRFNGYELKMTRREIEDSPHMFNDIEYDSLKFGSGTYSILKDAIEARVAAQGNQSTSKKEQEESLGANAQYDITVWNTHLEFKEDEKSPKKIKKVRLFYANNRDMIIGFQVLKNDLWPIIDRPLYPTSYDFDGTSIPDLVEDKQRARAVAQNLALDMMKADMYPMYIYDSNRITNRGDLKFDFNKFIPVDPKDRDITGAIQAVSKASPNLALLNFILNTLDVSAQKSTATPDIQQGIQSQKDRPLGETNLIKGSIDTRYSLSAKIFGWSEKRFWQQWYRLYKDNFKEDIDEKVLRLVGAFGPKWRPLKRDNLIARLDPDIKIESKIISRAKQLEERISLGNYFVLAFNEPNSNRRWGLKKLARLNGLEKDEVDRLFPLTIDEREAEEENKLLNENKTVVVLREQDHNIHNEVHAKANDTPATRAHTMTHNKALMVRRKSPEFFPENPMETALQPPGTKPLSPGGASTVKPVMPGLPA